MNPIDENRPISDDHRFDLLVDGELSEPQRRELLSQLDDEPGGWRCCALAFLEGQSWKQDLGALLGEATGQQPAKRPTRWPRLSGPTGTLLAMAASFLVALFLGGLVQSVWWSESPAAGPGINELVVTEPPGTPAPDEKSPQNPPKIPPEQPGTPSGKVWLVELPGADGQGQTIRLPAVERDQLGENWLESLPAPMSPEILERLREAGLQVEQRREVLPLWMEDGRRLVVPVDNVDIRYVGYPTL
jgi:hypothetical protein